MGEGESIVDKENDYQWTKCPVQGTVYKYIHYKQGRSLLKLNFNEVFHSIFTKILLSLLQAVA